MALPSAEQIFAEAQRRGITLSDEQKQKITSRISNISPVAPPAEVQQNPKTGPLKFVWDELVGMGEAGLNVATTTASTLALAPAMGLAVSIDGFIDGDSFTKVIEDTKNAALPLIGNGYQPVSQRGQAYTQAFQEIAGGMQQAAEGIAGANTGPNGTVDPQLLSLRRGMNAALGPETVNDNNLWVLPAILQTGLEAVPGIVSGSTLSGLTRATPGRGVLAPERQTMLRDRQDARARAENVGIETGFVQSRLQSDPERLRGLQESAQRILGRPANSTQDLELIAQRLVRLEREESAIVNSLYEQAKAGGRRDAPLPTTLIARTGDSTNQFPAGALKQDIAVLRNYYDRLLGEEGMAFDLDNLPISSKRLVELEKIIDSGENRIVTINRLEQWRKGNNANRPRGEQGMAPTERKVLSLLNSRYDRYMDNLYARDMLSGDRDTLKSWQMARGAAQRHAERFFDDNFVERLQDMQLSAADVKSIIFGASATGAKASAVRAVRELKEILGTGSSEWAALKGSIIFDITKPLVKENPTVGDFEKFSKGVNKLFDDRRELLDEMFSADEIQSIRDMQRVATRMNELTPSRKMFDISLGLARFTAGSNLARAQQRVGLVAGAARRIFTFTSDKRRADYINAIAGYDVMAPLIPKRAVAIPAAIESQSAQSEAQR